MNYWETKYKKDKLEAIRSKFEDKTNLSFELGDELLKIRVYLDDYKNIPPVIIAVHLSTISIYLDDNDIYTVVYTDYQREKSGKLKSKDAHYSATDEEFLINDIERIIKAISECNILHKDE